MLPLAKNHKSTCTSRAFLFAASVTAAKKGDKNVPNGSQFSSYINSQCLALWSEDGKGNIAIQAKLHEKYALDPHAFPGWGKDAEQ